MSISNSTRASAHVSITGAFLDRADSQFNRRISGVEGKEHTYRKTEQKVHKLSKKDQNSGKKFTSTAQEIYSSVSSTFNELVDLTHNRLNPFALASLNSSQHSSYNNLDLKRHQNYFNQMMNFDNPSGSWIDRQV